jgi:hypothetical protein
MAGEQLGDGDAVALAIRVLLETVDHDAAEALSGRRLLPTRCQGRFHDPRCEVSRDVKRNPILPPGGRHA